MFAVGIAMLGPAMPATLRNRTAAVNGRAWYPVPIRCRWSGPSDLPRDDIITPLEMRRIRPPAALCDPGPDPGRAHSRGGVV